MIISPDHLLEQAERLTVRQSGGAPRQVDLRRAISSAYYGLFHAVLTEAADTMLGKKDRNTPAYELIYRSIKHDSVRKVCESVRNPNLPLRLAKYQPPGGFGAELQTFAEEVIERQGKRHAADYDPLFRVRTSDVNVAVREARTALDEFRKASVNQRKAFVLLVLFSRR